MTTRAENRPAGDRLADRRRRRLLLGGFPGLVERGCPAELAARILAPLEEER